MEEEEDDPQCTEVLLIPNVSSWRVDWGYVKFLMCFPNFWTFWPKILFSKYGSKKDKTINISRNNEPIYYQWGLKWKFMIADTLFKTFFFKKVLEIWFFGFFFLWQFFYSNMNIYGNNEPGSTNLVLNESLWY